MRREEAEVAHETFCRARSGALGNCYPWPLLNGYAAPVQHIEGTKRSGEGTMGKSMLTGTAYFNKPPFPKGEMVVFHEMLSMKS